ncbi:hypothetical protein SADUNF_Sadunf16G0106300 [Salix dunnii]|uniref:Uncharacterized protein n=1 Tax=Salix dunnii TaxID=1413687 RepID=A0A835J817_9ROSI|nr:hypothetical protein SADUNF_Sadunf16G0106300 [Salix dunnii]
MDMHSCTNTRAIHVFTFGLCFCLSEGCPNKGNTPIFRTGSGKSVALKQYSIAKALVVLGGGEDGEACGGDNEFSFLKLLEKGNEDDGNAPIFHAGSGKSVV